MRDNPAISVVLPVYNAQLYVREAVESILAQTFTNFELIIINDGSSDDSGSILRELASHDSRIILVERANGGLVSALNEGIERAKGGLIARMDADDIAMPDRFAQQYKRMSNEPCLAVLGSFIRIINMRGEPSRLCTFPVSTVEVGNFIEHGCPVAHPSVMMRRDVVLKVGGYRKIFKHCEDYDLWLRITECGYGIANLPKVLLKYRVHESNVSVVHINAQILGSLLAKNSYRMRKAGLPDPISNADILNFGLIDVLPDNLRRRANTEFFVMRHSGISLASNHELHKAWKEYQKLVPQKREEAVVCHFLIRLMSGAIRSKDFNLAHKVFGDLLLTNPLLCSGFLWIKIKNFILAKI